jgi:hypothetical protein
VNPLAIACAACALRPSSPGAALLLAGMIAVPFVVAAVVARSLR